MIALLIFVCAVFVGSLVLHEVGHYIYLWRDGYDPSVHWSKRDKWFVVTTSGREPARVRCMAAIWGIGFGLVWLMFWGGVTPLALLLIPLYGWGCRSDIDKIIDYAGGR